MSLDAIFSLRRFLDLARQREFELIMTELYDTIPLLMPPTRHSYGLTEDHRTELTKRVAAYGACMSRWSGEAQGDYLYSLASIGKLVRNVAHNWFDYQNDDVAFDQVHTASQGKWIRLSRFTTTHVAGLRGFSWWTSLDITAESIWNAWRRVGLVDEWIAEKSVFLRCPVERTRHVTKVPTVVDGFDGPIFEPAHETPRPVVGTAIDLSTIPFQPGAPEFVLTAIAPQDIEILPITIPESLKANGTPAPKEPTMLRLRNYYESLPR